MKDFSNGRTVLCNVSYTPTYSHRYIDHGKQKFRVVAVEDAIAQVRAGEEPYLKAKDLPVLEQVLKQTRAQLGKEGDPKILSPKFTINRNADSVSQKLEEAFRDQ